MAITRVSGYADYASTGTTGFIPELYSAKLIEEFLPSVVYTYITSNDYVGELPRKGDNIIIRTEPDVTVVDYSGVGSTINPSDYQVPTSSVVELPIDQAKAVFIRLSDVDKHQSDIDLATVFAKKASEKMAVAMDKDVLTYLPTGVNSVNSGATAGKISGGYVLGTTSTPVQISTSNALSKLLDLNAVLDEQEVPREGRWAIIPSWYSRLLKESDLKQAYLTGDSVSPLRTGLIGEVDGLRIFQSNNLPKIDATTDYWNVLAGHNLATAWAANVETVETMRNPFDFGDMFRALIVYGRKVIKPEALALLRAYK